MGRIEEIYNKAKFILDNNIIYKDCEVNELGLKDVITFDDGGYKIVGWADLETRFNDDRFIQNKTLGERGER